MIEITKSTKKIQPRYLNKPPTTKLDRFKCNLVRRFARLLGIPIGIQHKFYMKRWVKNPDYVEDETASPFQF